MAGPAIPAACATWANIPIGGCGARASVEAPAGVAAAEAPLGDADAETEPANGAAGPPPIPAPTVGGAMSAWAACSPACRVASAALIAPVSATPTTAAAGDPPDTAGGNGTMIAAAAARNVAP
ncbi:hypothetical protein [Mycobacterium pseudokansasii]|uniref:hypothetical protein n=1 Tax=Mycobacterium pseudokansasii TaxID=2341080 RepID=UPI000F289701|nr:hypothetical protein [Mycobacterium pseudokansasii]VAZ91662.1 hypothetical protein LAUMK21_01366 [Mycobacterium pseudokansasii]